MVESFQTQSARHHFFCLPYLNLGSISEIDLLFAKVWNFNILKEKYIPDEALRNQVTRMLEYHRNSWPNPNKATLRESYSPLHGIGLITTSRSTEQEPDEVEKEKINDARFILFINFIATHNTITRNFNSGHSMASSENYQYLYFSTTVGYDHVSENTGFVVPTMHGGIKIDEHLLIKPLGIPHPNFDLRGDLIKHLLKLRLKKKKVFRRLISAVEIFYESYYNSPEISHNARILLQASAFEILLCNGGGDARKTVKEYLKKFADYPEDRNFQYKSERRNKPSEIENGTKKIMWADRFFSLRNHIAHGLVPKEKEYFFGEWQRHFDIALYFFIFCLKRKIEEELKRELFGDDIIWKNWTDDLHIPPKKYTGFEYDEIGRRYWKRLKLRNW